MKQFIAILILIGCNQTDGILTIGGRKRISSDNLAPTRVVAPPVAAPAPIAAPIGSFSGGSAVKFTSPEAQNHAANLKKCMDNWGTHPFGEVTVANFKYMAGAYALGINDKLGDNPILKTVLSTVTGGSSTVQLGKVEDMIPTPNETLVMIGPSANIDGKIDYKLMNPKGWYCLDITGALDITEEKSNKFVTETLIKYHCDIVRPPTTSKLGISFKNGASGAPGDNTLGVEKEKGKSLILGVGLNAKVRGFRQTPQGTSCP